MTRHTGYSAVLALAAMCLPGCLWVAGTAAGVAATSDSSSGDAPLTASISIELVDSLPSVAESPFGET